MNDEPELGPLARTCSAFVYDARDDRLRARLWTTVLDWTSALFAGTGHGLYDAYTAALLSSEERGPCSVAGMAGHHPVSAAAQANAAISHFWEVDDAHRDSTSHPGITVLPAVMALAEARNLDAQTCAAAIVAGIETVIRVGSHFGAAHYGVSHTTATAGSLGAAAAAARAIGLDEHGTLSALGHAGTQAAGLWAFLDEGATDAKAFHASTAVRNGIAAARMAEAEITGAHRVLEAPRGMRRAWHLEACDPAWLLPGKDPLIHTLTVKGWPVCGQIHSALDCAAALAEAHPDLAASDAPVTVELPASALAIAGIADPHSVAEAKFSTAFCIAATLCGKPPSFAGLTPALVADETVRARMATVDVTEEPAFTARFPAERPARVTIAGEDGAVRDERHFRRGDPEAPWDREAMVERTSAVLGLTSRTVDAGALVAWCDALSGAGSDWHAGALYGMLSPERRTAEEAMAL
ncbi:MmgE/PrpD family protein [Pararhizobium mangrovi]|nr:MmgE/PrpD family protein [Pararhizobium mangrovi]